MNFGIFNRFDLFCFFPKEHLHKTAVGAVCFSRQKGLFLLQGIFTCKTQYEDEFVSKLFLK